MTRRNDKELLRRYHEEGDLAAREQLIEQYMSLVRSLARRYSCRGEQLDDLVQVGTIGLIKAIDRFDIDRGVELTTYATPNIIGEIKRHFRDKGWAVRVPRRLQEQRVPPQILFEQDPRVLGEGPGQVDDRFDPTGGLVHLAGVFDAPRAQLARAVRRHGTLSLT